MSTVIDLAKYRKLRPAESRSLASATSPEAGKDSSTEAFLKKFLEDDDHFDFEPFPDDWYASC